MISYDFFDISDIEEGMQDEVREALEVTSKALFRRVVALSPVLRGHYRASWKMSKDTPNTSFIREGGTEESPLPPPRTPRLSFKNDFAVIIISNSIPYAEKIENGYSDKAPAGVLDIALAELGLT